MTGAQPQSGDGEQPGGAGPSAASQSPASQPPTTGLEERLHARLVRVERLLGAAADQSHLPAWLRPTQGEWRWPVGLAVVVAIALQLLVPRHLAFQPWWLLPAIEGALFVALMVANPTRINRESAFLRGFGLALVAVASLATAWSVLRLVYVLILGKAGVDAGSLLLTGAAIWLTNVIVFALWYWESDRGGPAARANARHEHPAFLFAQMTTPEVAPRDWEPVFVDYLYLSFTNATAFSPTDTLPLARWAKLVMMFQSAVSLATVVLVLARAVNILG